MRGKLTRQGGRGEGSSQGHRVTSVDPRGALVDKHTKGLRKKVRRAGWISRTPVHTVYKRKSKVVAYRSVEHKRI